MNNTRPTTDFVEVLAPAGSFDVLKAAVRAGADAVYVAGQRYGARAYARNFSQQELLEALDYVHLRGCRLHLTVNTLMKESELGDALYDFLAPLVERGLDALIVQDLGVIRRVHRWFPDLPLHASTQMSVTSPEGARLLLDQGVTRVIAARELSPQEIQAIAAVPGLEVEVFVHGAMCYAYSGKCLFSSTMGERSGNRGTCAQPCRLAYRTAPDRPEQYWLSMQDLNALEVLPRLLAAGVCSLKIEGRMKDSGYVTAVTSLYRRYVDRYQSSGDGTGCKISGEDRDLARAHARSIAGPGYYIRRNGPEMITPQDPSFHTSKSAAIPDNYQDASRLQPVKAALCIEPGRPAVFDLRCRDKQVRVTSAEPVAAAAKAPLESEQVKRRMEKTDQWPFALIWQELRLADNAFMPVSAMNAMRREGFSKLADQLLTEWRRQPAASAFEGRTEASGTQERAPISGLHALAATKEQVEALLTEPQVRMISVESDLTDDQEQWMAWVAAAQRSPHGKRLMIALPHVWRPAGERCFVPPVFEADRSVWQSCDGVLVRSVDEVAWLTEHQIPCPVYTDYLVYGFNSEAVRALSELQVRGICYSPEMSKYDLQATEEALTCDPVALRREVLVYGYQIRMISAQCVLRNTAGCDKQSRRYPLTDRRGVQFSVQNRCDSCYNILYNSVPIALHHQLPVLERIGHISYRADFTGETAGEVHRVIGLLTGDRRHYEPAAYTKGHFTQSIL